MTSSTSTGDVQYELQNTESLLDVKENEQISGKKREDDIYEEPARVWGQTVKIERMASEMCHDYDGCFDDCCGNSYSK